MRGFFEALEERLFDFVEFFVEVILPLAVLAFFLIVIVPLFAVGLSWLYAWIFHWAGPHLSWPGAVDLGSALQDLLPDMEIAS